MRELKREDYDAVVHTIQEEVKSNHPETCFFTYGSYETEELDPGRSDIDGGFILNSLIVTPKEQIADLARIVASCLKQSRIRLQMSIMDRTTTHDGRFLAYTTDMTDYLKKSAVVRAGPNVLQQLNGLDYKAGVLTMAANHLRYMREGLLHAEDHKAHDPARLRINLERALDHTSKLPGKLVWLQTGTLLPSKTETNRALQRLLPDVGLGSLVEICELQKDQVARERILSDSEASAKTYSRIVTSFEEVVGHYLKEFPLIGKREIR